MCNEVLAAQRTAAGGDDGDSPVKAWPTQVLPKSTFSRQSITAGFLCCSGLAASAGPHSRSCLCEAEPPVTAGAS